MNPYYFGLILISLIIVQAGINGYLSQQLKECKFK